MKISNLPEMNRRSGISGRDVLSSQRGISLVILLILTILGMASMSTSSLESKMSGNTQATTMALEAAESGIHQQLNSLTNLQITPSQLYSFGSGGSAVTASVSINFIEYSTPVRGAGFSSAGNFQAGNFDQVSEGKTATALGGRATVHQGLSQIGAGSGS
jgi:hypothetical protein